MDAIDRDILDVDTREAIAWFRDYQPIRGSLHPVYVDYGRLLVARIADLEAIVAKLPTWIAYTKDSRNIGILVQEMKEAVMKLEKAGNEHS